MVALGEKLSSERSTSRTHTGDKFRPSHATVWVQKRHGSSQSSDQKDFNDWVFAQPCALPYAPRPHDVETREDRAVYSPKDPKQSKYGIFPILKWPGVCDCPLPVSSAIDGLTRTILPLPKGLSALRVIAATAAHQKLDSASDNDCTHLLHITFGGK